MTTSVSGSTNGSSATAPFFAMDARDVEEVLRVVELSIAHTRWRLKSYAKRRLQTDILALCTGLRPVVMVDYGGKLPELQDRLCLLMQFACKESPLLLFLRIMLIEDMIYMIHVRELAKHAANPLQPHFVDLEQDPPQILSPKDNNNIIVELLEIQKLFSSAFPVDEDKQRDVAVPTFLEFETGLDSEIATGGAHASIRSSQLIDVTRCLKDTHVTIPTLNGWLLGYPIVYLFGKNHIGDAVYNLSTKHLHVYKILVSRMKNSCEELMSFSVPYELSMRKEKEAWCETFLAQMMAKFHRCKLAWKHLRLEVVQCYPHAIAL